ncbi:Anaphase-promoting complex subunit 10 [Dimargaris xerosporica]|nr:Anaphase-promoting complex subunit 10 [Dimargaris xerosporica]
MPGPTDADIEIGHLAAWQLSTARPCFGVEQLRDNDLSTFWQSNGSLPHSITLQFPARIPIQRICLYLDIGQDESYTPELITIHAGDSLLSLQKIATKEFANPKGWQTITTLDSARRRPVELFVLQIQVHSNHQHGKDCHIRQVKVYSSKGQDPVSYTSLAFGMASTLR